VVSGALVGLTLIVIAVGGIIRIYDAGESCPDWPTCFGTWGFEISESEQEKWYNENPHEMDSRGSSHRYTSFQIFTEWFHRLLAGAILGPLVIINWMLVRKEGHTDSRVNLASHTSLLLILWQGFVGWLTVEMDNKNWSVAIHLISALAFTMSLVWIWLLLTKIENKTPKWLDYEPFFSNKWRRKIGLLAIIALFSLFSGTFVSTIPGANNGCSVDGFPDSWPLCSGVLIKPLEDIALESQIVHRWIVGIVGTIMLGASFLVWKESREDGVGKIVRDWIWFSTALYLANSVIGASYILSWDFDEGFVEFLSLIHLLLASITFLSLATAWLNCTITANRGD